MHTLFPLIPDFYILIFSIEVEWKLLYIGSSKDVKYDQMLDTFSMGPLEYGSMQFDLEVTKFKIKLYEKKYLMIS